MRPVSFLLVSVAALALACAKDKASAEVPQADSAGAAAADPADADDASASGEVPAWAAMDFDLRKKHMMKEVTPTMAALFQGMNAEHYAEFNCVTCHGPGAKEGQFEMPSPSLPALPPNGDFAAIAEAKPDVMQFMGEQVVPQMAALLDQDPYDPATGQGFGCYGCHAVAQ